jgi:DNA repair protein RadC
MLNRTCLSQVPDEELLTAFLPYVMVKELVAEYGTVQKILLSAYPGEFQLLRGIGPVKAKQLQYICELAKRLYKANADLPSIIRTPKDAFDRLQEMQHLGQEQIRVLYLTTKNGVMAEEIVVQGTLHTAVVGPREIFCRAVRLRAASIIIVHNHPSGDPTPSSEDIALTKKLVEAGKILEIPVLDHVIIGQGRYVSLKEQGII